MHRSPLRAPVANDVGAAPMGWRRRCIGSASVLLGLVVISSAAFGQDEPITPTARDNPEYGPSHWGPVQWGTLAGSVVLFLIACWAIGKIARPHRESEARSD